MFLDDYKTGYYKSSTTYNEFYKIVLNELFEICLKIFEWKNLPDTIPQHEIEFRLFLYGKCAFLKDDGKYIVATCNENGVTEYYDMFKYLTYNTPTKSGERVQNRNTVLIKNNALKNPFMPYLHKTASMIAHIDVSIVNLCVDMRENTIITAINQNSAKSAKDYRQKIYNGELETIVNKGFSQLEIVKTDSASGGKLNELINTRENIYSAFLEKLGIKRSQAKKERMITDEITQNDNYLNLNIENMFECRKKAVEKINEIFGLNISVSCNAVNETDTELIEKGSDENVIENT